MEKGNTLRNPLYHWMHPELQRYFDVMDILNPDTAKKIYETCTTNGQLNPQPATVKVTTI